VDGGFTRNRTCINNTEKIGTQRNVKACSQKIAAKNGENRKPQKQA